MPRRSSKKRPRNVRARRNVDENMNDFKYEMEALGKKMEKHGNSCTGWYYETFGVSTPIVSAVISLIFFALGVFALGFVARGIGSTALLSIHNFLSSYMWLFFIIFIVSSVFSYFSRKYPREYLVFSPFSKSFGITVFLWVVASVINVINTNSFLAANVSSHIMGNLLPIFWFFLLLGYLILLLRLSAGNIKYISAGKTTTQHIENKRRSVMPQRLYRSGKEKILGGVCGGIAEYLDVDPVIIRLIWIAAVFAWGAGILFYIIAWIIMPRNPKHKWK